MAVAVPVMGVLAKDALAAESEPLKNRSTTGLYGQNLDNHFCDTQASGCLKNHLGHLGPKTAASIARLNHQLNIADM